MVGSIDPGARHSVGSIGAIDRLNVGNLHRGNHLGQRSSAGAANRPDIWIQASRFFRRLLLQAGAVHIWARPALDPHILLQRGRSGDGDRNPLNNKTWNAGAEAYARLSWPSGKGYYSVRNFLILQEGPSGNE
jgi:hypothetical protein